MPGPGILARLASLVPGYRPRATPATVPAPVAPPAPAALPPNSPIVSTGRLVVPDGTAARPYSLDAATQRGPAPPPTSLADRVKVQLDDSTARGRPSTEERVPSNYGFGVAGRVWFLPHIESATHDSPEIRAAMRLMLRDPFVKAAWFTSVLSVCSEDNQVQPSEPGNAYAEEQARFVERVLKDHLAGGVPGLIQPILMPLGSDGFSIVEPVWAVADRGRLEGKVVIQAAKAKDTQPSLLRVEGDRFGNVLSLESVRRPGERFPISDFLYTRYMPIFNEALGMAAFRASYGDYWMRDTVRKLRIIHHEKKMAGTIKGTYADDADRPALETALRNMKTQTWVAVPDGVQIEAINLSNATEPDYKSFDDSLTQAIIIGITFAHLQIMEGDGGNDAHGDSQVQKGTSELHPWYLMSIVLDTINSQLIPRLIDYNFPFPAAGGYPKLTLGAVSNAALKEQLEIIGGAQQAGFDNLSKKYYAGALSLKLADETDPGDKLGGGASAAAGQQMPGGPMDGGPPGPFDGLSLDDSGGGPPPPPPDDDGGDGGGGNDDGGDQFTTSVEPFAESFADGPPGPPPRPGLQWKGETHRWINPKTGDEHLPDGSLIDPGFDFAKAMKFGKNGMRDSFHSAVASSIRKTGDVPGTERQAGTKYAQLWDHVKKAGFANHPEAADRFVRAVGAGEDAGGQSHHYAAALNKAFAGITPSQPQPQSRSAPAKSPSAPPADKMAKAHAWADQQSKQHAAKVAAHFGFPDDPGRAQSLLQHGIKQAIAAAAKSGGSGTGVFVIHDPSGSGKKIRVTVRRKQSQPQAAGAAGQPAKMSEEGDDFAIMFEFAEYDESKHPRDDHGRFVDKDEIEWAKSDPDIAADLRKQVTRPDERAKLEAMIGGEDGGRAQPKSPAAAAATPAPAASPRGPANPGIPDAGRPPLTAAEVAAVHDYTQDGYDTLNRSLRRDGRPSDAGKAKQLHESLQGAFAKAKPFDTPVLAHRHMTIPRDQIGAFVQAAQSAAAAGGEFPMGGYVSTTVDPEYKPDNVSNVVMNIKATRGLDLSPHSQFPEQERELLLNHGSGFKVAGVRQEGKRWVIDMEQTR